MNRFSFLLYVLLLLFQNTCFSQTVSGTINAQNMKIEGASIVAKRGNTILNFSFSDKEGNFKLNKTSRGTVEIQVFKAGYEKQKITFFLTKDTILKIELFKKEILLNEVIIKKESAITLKKDTVTYNPSFFKDGTERVVEDLLKKLPGITVNNEGKIFFKNKEIESLMLEGDNLFNSQYSIGSKNISIDLVESIEAIENFNTNKVLHKIAESNKVALNLKLKENKTALSLNTILENDFYSKYNDAITALVLNSKNKGFSTLSLNNVGINNAPNVSFSNKTDDPFSKGRNKELISEGSFPNFLGDSNSLLNSSQYNYTSYIKDLTKKTKSTFGFNYYQDKISQDFINQTNYEFDSENFNLFSEEYQIKRPRTLSFSNTTTYYNGNDIQLETEFLIQSNNSNLNNAINNNNVLQRSQVDTGSFFIGGKSELTKKISDSSALNANVFLAHTSSKQDFSISPGIAAIDASDSKNTQKSNINSLFLNSDLEFYKNWNYLRLKVSNNFELQEDKLSTLFLNGEDVQTNNAFLNDLRFKTINDNLKLNVAIKGKKFKLGFTAKLLVSYLQSNDQVKNKNDGLFNVDYKFLFNKKNSINLSYNESVTRPKLSNLFEGFVLSSFREVINNQNILGYIKNSDIRLDYNISDFYNTFFMSLGGGYSFADKDYYSTNQITSELTYKKSLLLDYGNHGLHFNFAVDKLVPFLKTTAKFKSAFSSYSTYNFINDSELRQVKGKALTTELFLYTGFKSKINFQHTLTTRFSFFKVNAINNTLTQIKNEFKIIYKISGSNNFKFEFQNFLPDTKKKKNYSFVNLELTQKLSKYNIETYLKGHNLLNIKKFENSYISDYESASYTYNLQERYIVLGLVCKFF